VRLINLSKFDVWFDETCSLHTALGNFKIFNFAGFFYNNMILAILNCVTKHILFSVRLFSVFCDLVAAYFVYRLGTYIFSRRVGVIAVTLLLFSGFNIWYAQEITVYAFSGALAMISFYYFFKTFYENKMLYLIIYDIFSLMLIVTLPQANVVWIIELIFFCLLSRNDSMRKYFIFGFIITSTMYIAFFLQERIITCFSIVFLKQFWISKILWKDIALSLPEFLLGYSASALMYSICGILIVLTLLSLFRKFTRKVSKEIVFCLLVVFLPITIFIFISYYKPVYLVRYFVYITGIFYIVISVGIAGMKKPAYLLSAFLTLMIVSDVYYFSDYASCQNIYHKGVPSKSSNLKEVFKYVDLNAKEGDIVAATSFSLGGGIISFYSRHNIHFKNFIFKRKIYLGKINDERQSLDIPLFILYCGIQDNSNYWYDLASRVFNKDAPYIYISHEDLLTMPFKRLWLIASWWDKVGEDYYNSIAIKKYYDLHFNLKEYKEYKNMKLYLYEKEGL